MALPLRPKRGGFFRAFGCAQFIFEYLSGHAPYGSPHVNPSKGAPQAEIFYHYKNALIRENAMEKAIRREERSARREQRAINPENIDTIYKRYLQQSHYKTTGCRYHSFIVYFANLTRLHWVQFTGQVEHSEFQDHYPKAQSRRYYRITAAGRAASKAAWTNPLAVLYGK